MRSEVEILVLFTVSLNLCSTEAREIPTKTVAQTQAKTNSQANSSSDSTYFLQDPYGPNTYAFGYEVDDKHTGNVQFRDERRYLNGTIEGSFGYLRPDQRITLTHYLVDKSHGYQSQTQTYRPGEKHKLKQWRPWAVKVQGGEQHHANAVYDGQQHLNVTTHNIPEHVVEGVKAQHDIDLGMKAARNDGAPDSSLQPTLQDIVNGQIPLTLQTVNKSNVVGFETVKKFIPEDFPIVPFELPAKVESDNTVSLGLDKKQEEPMSSEQGKNKSSKYDNSKQNNAEKAIQDKEVISKINSSNESKEEQMKNALPKASKEKELKTELHKKATEMPEKKQKVMSKTPNDAKTQNQSEGTIENTPLPLVDSSSVATEDDKWYRKVINDARKEFLENLPSIE